MPHPDRQVKRRSDATAVAGTVPPTRSSADPDTLPRLLWGWPEIVQATGLARRTIERELSKGLFPKPIRHVGRRPFWRPSDIKNWASGDDWGKGK